MYHTFHCPLPSCTVDIGLFKRLERYFNTQIPKLLRNDLKRMMGVLDLDSPKTLRSYRILIIDKEGEKEFTGAGEMITEDFLPTIKAVRIELKIGKPQVLSLSFNFSARERPDLQVWSLGNEAREHAPKIAADLEEIVKHWGNRNSQFFRRPFQLLLATLLPLILVALGFWAQVDAFTLLASQGWLLLLCLAQARLLPYLYPFVTFVMPKKFSFHRTAIASLFLMNGLVIVGYTGLLAANLGLLVLPRF